MNIDKTNVNLFGANHALSHGNINNISKNQLENEKLRAKDDKFQREQERKNSHEQRPEILT
jgi:hypothetical protein